MIMAGMALSYEKFGLVLSSFSIGYMLGQIPGGIFADRWGVRPVLIVTPLFWALFTGLTGLVASLAGFILVRLLFGLSEGASNSSIFKAIGDNFTSQERSRAVAISTTALAVAPLLAGPVVGFLLGILDWRWLFGILAVPALLASGVNCLLVPTHDTTEPTAHGENNAGLRSVAANPVLWVIGGMFFFFNIAYWGYLGWMPSYLSSAHGVDIKHLGLLSAVPYLFALVGLVLSGWLGSTGLYHYRAHIQIVCYLGGALALYWAYSAPSLAVSLAGLSAAAFFLYGSFSSLGAIVLELAPEGGRATFVGAASTMGQLGGVFAPWIIGRLVSSTGNFAWGFALMATALVVAAALLATLISSISAKMRK
ncbi:MAG: MFS transporter [Novosphingobium sp.]